MLVKVSEVSMDCYTIQLHLWQTTSKGIGFSTNLGSLFLQHHFLQMTRLIFIVAALDGLETIGH